MASITTIAFSVGQGRSQSGHRGVRFEPGTRHQHPLQEDAPVNRLGSLGEVYRPLVASLPTG